MNRDIFRQMKAKKAAVRHGHPSRGATLIVVAGASGKTTTARLLEALLLHEGKRVAVFTNKDCSINSIPYTPGFDQSADATHRAISAARKQRCDTVILEITDELIRHHVLPTLSITLALITSKDTHIDAVLSQPLEYAVMPSDFNSDSTSAVPSIAAHQMITFGEDSLADARIESVTLYRLGTEIKMIVDHQTEISLATHLVGSLNARNVAAAVAGAYVLGASVSEFADGIADLETVAGNFETIEPSGAYHVIVDGATSKQSVEAVLTSAKHIAKRRLLVAGDETVSDEARQLIAVHADQARLVGSEDTGVIAPAESLDEAIALSLRAARKGDIVLCLGKQMIAKDDSGELAADMAVEQAR